MSLTRGCKTTNSRDARKHVAGVEPLETKLRKLQLLTSCEYFNSPNMQEGIRAPKYAELSPNQRG